MEKPMKKPKLPKSDSIRELAAFWDTHDLTDFEAELEEVSGPIFKRTPNTSMTIDLPAADARTLKKIGHSRGVRETTVARQWVIEKLRQISVRETR